MMMIRWIRLCLLSSALAFAFNQRIGGQVDMKSIRSRQHIAVANPSDLDCPRDNPDVQNGTLVDRLWKRNCDIVNQFLENAFSIAQARQDSNGTFGSFQYYSVQDYYYMLETIPLKALLLTTQPPMSAPDLRSNISITISSMDNSLEYADNFYQSLTNQLQVPEIVINNGSFQTSGLGYVKWLQGNVNLGLFSYKVSQIACVYGWGELANSLAKREDLNNTSLFYREWILPNQDWSYGAEISNKLEQDASSSNIDEKFEVYSQLFRQGMLFEIAFFESAIGKTLEYVTSTV